MLLKLSTHVNTTKNCKIISKKKHIEFVWDFPPSYLQLEGGKAQL